MATTHAIKELLRLPLPAPLPLGLACDGDTLWMASRETHRVYAIDSKRWTVGEEAQADPAVRSGWTMVRRPRGAARRDWTRRKAITTATSTASFPVTDSRAIASPARISSPARTSLLTATRFSYRRHRIARFSHSTGRVISCARSPSKPTPVGMTIAGAASSYSVTGDEEFENLELWKVDAHTETPQITVLASIPFDARGLAYDGNEVLDQPPRQQRDRGLRKALVSND